MNTRLAFEDYTALHHRLETLGAVDEKPEKSHLAFETRPAPERVKEEKPQLALETLPAREATAREAMAREAMKERETVQEPHEKAPPLWRSILQLRVLLPYVSKLLPLLESGFTSHSSPAPAHHTATEAIEKAASDLQAGHRELRIQLQDQAVESKHVQEQLERLREATERNTLEQQELIEDLKSVAGTIKLIGWSGLTLLTGLLGAVAYVALHLRQ